MLKKLGMLLAVCFLAVAIVIGGCSSKKSELVSTSEKYPTKPITMIVPFGAGGSSDLMARAMEKVAVKYLGQPLVVVNKPGGAATIGWNELAGAQPDGYTVGVTSISVNLQPLYGPTRYNYPTALEPLVQVMFSPVVVAVKADQPWQNIAEVIKYAKQHPGELKYAHPGLGTGTHVVAEIFTKAAAIDIAQVPFRGGAEAVTAVLGGHVQLIFSTTTEVKEHVKSGKLRVLAVAEKQRLTDAELKHVPTFIEQGLDVTLNMWQGVGAPKGLPEEVKTRLAEGFKGIVNDPEFKKSIEHLGLTVEYLGPQESAAKWIAEQERLTKIVKDTGIAERIAAQKN